MQNPDDLREISGLIEQPKDRQISPGIVRKRASMSIHNAGLGDNEALVVRPKAACQMLAIGVTRLYELVAAGELESFKDGASRKITTRSIRGYVERPLERSRTG
jgi:excisionase family DNA binding protein